MIMFEYGYLVVDLNKDEIVLNCDGFGDEDIEIHGERYLNALNKLGEHGWELVTLTKEDNVTIFLLKRPKDIGRREM